TSFAVSFSDVAPSVSAASSSVSSAENVAASNSGVWSDYDDTVTLSASQGLETKHSDGTWSWAQTGDESDSGTVTITATNADGSTSTTSFAVSFSDVAPSVAVDSSSVSSAENVAATNSGIWSDYDDTVTLTASQGLVTKHGDGTWSL